MSTFSTVQSRQSVAPSVARGEGMVPVYATATGNATAPATASNFAPMMVTGTIPAVMPVVALNNYTPTDKTDPVRADSDMPPIGVPMYESPDADPAGKPEAAKQYV